MDSQPSGEQLCYVELLGPLRLTCAGQTFTQFATQKAATLLAYLALHPGPQPRERLMELLWPDRDLLAGRNNLSTALVSLRRQLEPAGVRRGSVLVGTHVDVGLNPEVLSTDVGRFGSLLKHAARSDNAAQRADLLQRAVALYRDEILPGSYQDWAARASERIQSRLQGALQQLAQDQEGLGDLPGALETVQRSMALDPYSEEDHCHLVRLYAKTGRIGNAREAHQRFERLFQEEFGATPSPTTRKAVADLLANPPPPASLARTAASSPPEAEPLAAFAPRETTRSASVLPPVLSRFFGRDTELMHLAHLLLPFKAKPFGESMPELPCRLVTLIGPGGIGKTRLAIEFARQVTARFTSWCGFVPLADVTETGQVEQQLASALRLISRSDAAPLQAVITFLNQQDRPDAPPLLILDNLEHLLPASEERMPGEAPMAALVQTMLEQAPGLLVLCTSRRRLGVRGEQLVPVMPLPLPDDAAVDTAGERLSALLINPSVRLYVDRAQSVRPDFGLTPTNAPAILALCRQLEGNPLGIELAAAWVRVLPPRKMWERLTQGLDIPAGSYADLPARHRTLTAALDWSFRLLSPSQQRLFTLLSVFRGGWTLEAAEAVCLDEGNKEENWENQEVLSQLMALQEASLVTTTEQAEGQVRYAFLERIHAFSRQQLQSQQAMETLRRRHAAYFLNLAEEAGRYQRRPEEGEWLNRLEAEHENLRAALDWYLSDAGEATGGVQFVGALIRFWQIRGYWREGWEYAQRALARGSEGLSPSSYARLLNGAAGLAQLIGEVTQAKALFERCLEILRTQPDKAAVANVLHNLGFLALRQGDPEHARPFYEESLAIQRERNDPQGIADELHHLGMVAHERGDLATAQALYDESLALRRPLRDPRGIGNTLQCLANIASEQGDYAQAQRIYQEDLAVREALGDREGIASNYCNLSNLALLRGDAAQAKALGMQALTLQQELGDWHGMGNSLDTLAALFVEANQLRQAVRLYGASEAIRTQVKATRTPVDQQKHEEDLQRLREQLSTVEFNTAWLGSPELSVEQRIADLLSDLAE